MTNSNRQLETQPEHSPALLSVRAVAVRLSLSPASIYQMVRQGTLKAHRLGGRRGAIRIRPEDLEACLVGTQQIPAAATKTPKPPRVKLKHIKLG